MKRIDGRTLRQRVEHAYQSGALRAVPVVVVPLLGCGVGSYLGWALAFNLSTYRPNAGEWCRCSSSRSPG